MVIPGGVLSWPETIKDTGSFQTYKHCPSLLGTAECWRLPEQAPNGGSGTSSLSATALGIDCQSKALGSRLVLLYNGRLAVSIRPKAATVDIVDLSSRVGGHSVDCGGHPLSAVRCRSEINALVHETVVVSLVGGRVSVLQVNQDGTASIAAVGQVPVTQPFEEVVAETELERERTPPPSSLLPEVGEVWVTAAEIVATGVLRLLVYRAVRWGSSRRSGLARERGGGLGSLVEVQVLQMCPGRGTDERSPGVTSTESLALLYGSRPPLAACFTAAGTGALMLADAGFSPSSRSEVPDFDNSGGTPMVTALDLHRAQDGTGTHPAAAGRARCISWALPRGELLSGWAEDVAQNHQGLVVALSDGSHSVVFVRATLPDLRGPSMSDAPPLQPVLDACERVPGLGACASAREALCLLRCSPRRTFCALAEKTGHSAVAVFRTPAGRSRSATASPPLAELLTEGCEVCSMALTEEAILILSSSELVLCTLDASVQIEEEPTKQLVSRDRMPMGIDPQAVLRMLDAMGGD